MIIVQLLCVFALLEEINLSIQTGTLQKYIAVNHEVWLFLLSNYLRQ